MKITKYVLSKPVTSMLLLLALVFFGIMTFRNFKLELTPEISMPMYVVATIYPGASPEDIDKNVTKKMESGADTLTNVKEVNSISMENVSMLVIQYEYDTKMDQAYNDLKKMVDEVDTTLDENCQSPYIVEMDINAIPSIRMTVKNTKTEDIYNYVINEFVPEMERLSSVASVYTSGGRENYIKVSIRPEEVYKYNLSMSNIADIIKAADFSYPAGTLNVGDRKLSVSTSVKYNTVEMLKSIPIITGNKNTIYMEDIADISVSKKDATNIGRYNKEDAMIVSMVKNQSSTAVSMSNDIHKTIDKLRKNDPSLEVIVVEDDKDNIMGSLTNVIQTMVIAIVLSMLIIFLFFGDIKASLIVGTSIPISIISALILMSVFGLSLNIITLSSLVLGVGMMVDNSIVILEACFRSKEKYKDAKDNTYKLSRVVLDATQTVGLSVLGSTLTTCVVFAPLATITGISGQFFKPLGLTIVFCMIASYISSITIVPLCYVFLNPNEKEKAPLTRIIISIQETYKVFISKLLKYKKTVITFFLLLFFGSIILALGIKAELVPSPDAGMIKITIETKPSLTLSYRDNIYKEIEDFVSKNENVNNYLIASDAGSGMSTGSTDEMTLIAYLRDDRNKTTKDIVKQWKKEMIQFSDCSISVQSYSTSFTSNFSNINQSNFETVLQSMDYDKLKEANDNIINSLITRNDLIGVSSSLDNAAPLIKISVDPILAASEGFTPAQIGASINQIISGIEIKDMDADNQSLTITLEYPKDEYNNLEKVESIILSSKNNSKILLKDIANITYANSPLSISKQDKYYQSNITASFRENANENTKQLALDENVKPFLNSDVLIANNSYDEMLNEELSGLISAVIIAIFLVFIVMAMQFESIKYSFMVMFTVLFSFIGSIFMLWITNVKLSIPALLGFMMLIGTSVNNGILYVDSVNQLKEEVTTEEAIVQSGALRYRPILMTILTTIISMVPMSFAYGRSGEIMQGLALVNVGGLITSTITALYFLPILYSFMSKHSKISRFDNMKKIAEAAWAEVESDHTTKLEKNRWE
ncbi:MAG: efflux RND transporter permease subunit [Eubacteriales bacterium]|nr:efflux RND transporter permease subunit [Eubacteriales bacterium]